MSYVPNRGEKCRVVIPVEANYEQIRGHATEIRDQAAEALHQICQRHGFTATDQELIWSGSVLAARNSQFAQAVAHVPNGMHVFVFEATAA